MSIFSFIKSFYTTKFKVDKIFSMTMGEICEVCQKELDEKQGLKGKPLPEIYLHQDVLLNSFPFP